MQTDPAQIPSSPSRAPRCGRRVERIEKTEDRIPLIVLYTSGHGFGHASRDIEVINALVRMRPGIAIQCRTAAPRWLFDLTVRASIDFHSVESDTGIVQADSLSLDAPESIRRAAAFHRDFDKKADAEARALLESGARLVVADIPPLAVAAAARAGIPAYAFGNFTWDWIYEDYPEAAASPDLVPGIRDAYAQASGAWRLPMWGGFESIRKIVDVPLVARRSTRNPGEVRRRFGLPEDRPVVLASFGGFGVKGVPFDAVDCLGRCTLVLAETTVTRSGGVDRGGRRDGRVVMLDESELYATGYRYEDLVAAADVVVTKPGFGIIAECAANGTAIVYTSRGRFREYDVLVREMPRYVRCEFLSQADLRAGRWAQAVDRVMSMPAPPPARTDGADVVAGYILDAL
jgi:L-arabinokinase